ncbi:magnesium chelatase subunit D [Qipengyuania sp. G39]|uniref:Magnesium chelatase subunit D n=1 Tax=Qipengyuania profundimaris TaxID=3067652 RepID=A0ABT9HP63_9SPHN|nr:magnesium chelatase subunit D [Qipengyuania sp. G39]MDP4574945.1 magnesium chelatase subunit D [Qipengyuania sp. G39]
MIEAAAPVGPLDEPLLTLRLFLASPRTLGGLCLRGGGPARDIVLGRLRERVPNLRRLPPHIDDERLLGGLDMAASLAAGRRIDQRGLLDEASGGVIVAPMAERMSDHVAGRLAQAMERSVGAPGFGLVLLDDGIADNDRPPASLTERVAFLCDLSQVDTLDCAPDAEPLSAVSREVEPLDAEQAASIAATAAAFGITSIRPLLFAAEAARAHAALSGRARVDVEDLKVAMRLVLAPRAVHLPTTEEETEDTEPPQDQPPPSERDGSDSGSRPCDDVLLDAVAAAIPADLLAQLASGKARRNAQGQGGGKRRQSALRGKPLGARPGVPRGGARLALLDTLRAAVPWQPLRRGSDDDDRPLIVHKEDLRVRRFEERAAKLTIFCVDASGSAAAARLAEAKGAVELMLAQAYATRSEVALVAFRGTSAELILPPTRSLTRARRALAELPGGGGTPLALGLQAAREVAEAAENRGRTPHLVILTDGRGNIASDGSASRSRSAADAEAAAKAIAARGIEALVVDISARTGRDAPQLAQAMHARFLALPMADAHKLHAAVSAAKPKAA